METVNWRTIPLDELARIVENGRETIRQLDAKGTPSTLFKASHAEREAIYKERLAAEQG